MRDFPNAREEISRAVADRVNAHMSSGNRLSVEDVDRAFDRLGRKPEVLIEYLRDLILEPLEAPAALEGDRPAQEAADGSGAEVGDRGPVQIAAGNPPPARPATRRLRRSPWKRGGPCPR